MSGCHSRSILATGFLLSMLSISATAYGESVALTDSRRDVVLTIGAAAPKLGLSDVFVFRIELRNDGYVPYIVQSPLEIGAGRNLTLLVRDSKGSIIRSYFVPEVRRDADQRGPKTIRLDPAHYYGLETRGRPRSLGIRTAGTYSVQAIYRAVGTASVESDQSLELVGEVRSNILTVECLK